MDWKRNISGKTILAALVLATGLTLAGCAGGGGGTGPISPPPPPPSPPPPPVTQGQFPANHIGQIRGVNTQGAFRSVLHGNRSEEEVITIVANAINQLGFNSIRIGGTASFGSTFDDRWNGYGWTRYIDDPAVANVHPNDPYINEPWNFNVMAIKTAARAGVSVWIDFNTVQQEDEMNLALKLLRDNGVTLAGVTRDNEPYIDKRFADIDASYAELDKSRYRDGDWPAMFIAPPGGGSARRDRENKTLSLVNQYRAADEGIEVHIYYPPEATSFTPRDWIIQSLDQTADAYGTNNIMVGEWSGKNRSRTQETFTDTEIETIIADYLDIFGAREIDFYYQTITGEDDTRGLWNFVLNTPNDNRGADLFTNFNCGGPCMASSQTAKRTPDATQPPKQSREERRRRRQQEREDRPASPENTLDAGNPDGPAQPAITQPASPAEYKQDAREKRAQARQERNTRRAKARGMRESAKQDEGLSEDQIRERKRSARLKTQEDRKRAREARRRERERAQRAKARGN